MLISFNVYGLSGVDELTNDQPGSNIGWRNTSLDEAGSGKFTGPDVHNIARITRKFEYVVNAQRPSKELEPRPVEFQYWSLPVANNGTIETTWIHAVFNAHMGSRSRKPLRDLLDMYQSQITLSGRDFTSPELTFDVNQIFHSTVAWGLGSLFLEICDVLPANTFWQ